jgi:lipopolysaccharide biosynthesis regulator YciM
MQIKLLLIIVVVIFGAFFYLHSINPVDVDFALNQETTYKLPAAYLVTGGFLVGLVLLVINIIITDMRRAVRDMQIRKEKKIHETMLSNYRQGITALSKGNASKARQYFIRVIDVNPVGLDIYMRLSDAYLAEGAYKEALASLEKGNVMNPDSIDLLSMIARIAGDAGDKVRVEMALGDILKLDSDNQSALRGLRDLKLTAKDWSGAIELQKKLIYAIKGKAPQKECEEEDNRLMGFLYESAVLSADKGSDDSALATIKEIQRLDSSFVPASILQGELLLRQGNSNGALKLWEKGFDDSGDPVFLLKLEDLYLGRSEPDRALEVFRKAQSSRPRDIDLNIFLGRLYLRLEMVDEAIGEFERIQNDLEGSYYLELLLAEAYMRRNQSDKSARLLKKALKLNDVPQPSFSCVRCERSSEDWHSRCPRCSEWNTMKISRTVAARRDNPPEKLANLSVIR